MHSEGVENKSCRSWQNGGWVRLLDDNDRSAVHENPADGSSFQPDLLRAVMGFHRLLWFLFGLPCLLQEILSEPKPVGVLDPGAG